MSCPRCGDTRALFCGACGSRITDYSPCPWCGSVNEADNSFCCSCGRQMRNYTVCPWCECVNDENNAYCGNCGKSITFIPFLYSVNAVTVRDKLLELLTARDVDHKAAMRVATMAIPSQSQCPNCGGTSEVVSVSHEAAITPQRKLGVSALASILQGALQGLGDDSDYFEDFASQKLRETWGWYCLACGSGWLADPDDV